jgi:hypothetical protein
MAKTETTNFDISNDNIFENLGKFTIDFYGFSIECNEFSGEGLANFYGAFKRLQGAMNNKQEIEVGSEKIMEIMKETEAVLKEEIVKNTQITEAQISKLSVYKLIELASNLMSGSNEMVTPKVKAVKK